MSESLNVDLALYATGSLNKTRVWPSSGTGIRKKVRFLLKMFIRTSFFENLMTLSVLANTIVMALDRYDNTAQTKARLDTYNTVFTWIFIAEMAIKLLAIGPKKYVSEAMNLLDGFCVVISIIEIALF